MFEFISMRHKLTGSEDSEVVIVVIVVREMSRNVEYRILITIIHASAHSM